MLRTKVIQIILDLLFLGDFLLFLGDFNDLCRWQELFVESDNGRYPLGMAAGPFSVRLTGGPDGYLLLLGLVEPTELGSGSGVKEVVEGYAIVLIPRRKIEFLNVNVFS